MAGKILSARRFVAGYLRFVVWLDISKRVTPTVTTGTPITAATATSCTVTGTPLTVNAWVGWVIQTATVFGYITANTTSVITVTGWFSTTTGLVGTTPANATAYTVAALDERWTLRRDYPFGYNNAMAAVQAELVAAGQAQIAANADQDSGGTPLSIEGQTF